MKNYIKKNQPIPAIQFTNSFSFVQEANEFGLLGEIRQSINTGEYSLLVNKRSGNIVVTLSDWIIKEDGDFFRLSDEEFCKYFEESK